MFDYADVMIIGVGDLGGWVVELLARAPGLEHKRIQPMLHRARLLELCLKFPGSRQKYCLYPGLQGNPAAKKSPARTMTAGLLVIRFIVAYLFKLRIR